jgi:hypothetical protein
MNTVFWSLPRVSRVLGVQQSHRLQWFQHGLCYGPGRPEIRPLILQLYRAATLSLDFNRHQTHRPFFHPFRFPCQNPHFGKSGIHFESLFFPDLKLNTNETKHHFLLFSVFKNFTKQISVVLGGWNFFLHPTKTVCRQHKLLKCPLLCQSCFYHIRTNSAAADN